MIALRILLILLGLPVASLTADAQPRSAAEMVDAAHVRLLTGSSFHERQELHRKGYVRSLEVDKLLFNYRKSAGLPQPEGVKSGYSGWDSGFIRGHMAGHYLSAAGRLFAATGDKSFKEKSDAVVTGLGACQVAMGTGHLAAFPETVLDRYEGREGKSMGILVPYYTIHKVLAGLIDAWHYTRNRQALEIASKMADRYAARMADLTPPQIEKILRTDKSKNPGTEFGGMSDALTTLAAATGEKRHLQLARVFNREWFVQPLAAGEDRLAGLHANTHVAQAVGLAHYANATGDTQAALASQNFWKIVTDNRSFVIGGNSYKEWFDRANVEAGPSIFDKRVLPYNTAETCNTHNMLKLTRHLFEREPQRDHAEYIERALYNHILSSVAPDTGRMTYFHPLHGDFKIYLPGTECCVGSGIENTGRYGEGIYFQHQETLWVNLYIPSELNWQAKGMVIRQEGNIPYDKTVRLTVAKAAAPVTATLKLRIPAWVAGSAALVVNGKTVDLASISSGGYAEINRIWSAGDKVELTLPATLRLERAADATDVVSVLYGPLVLGARLGKAGMPKDFTSKDAYKNLPSAEVPSIVHLSSNPASWLRLADPATLGFVAHDCGPASCLRFQPVNAIHHERFSVYMPLLSPSSP